MRMLADNCFIRRTDFFILKSWPLTELKCTVVPSVPQGLQARDLSQELNTKLSVSAADLKWWYSESIFFLLVMAAMKNQTQNPTQEILVSAVLEGMRSQKRRKRKNSSAVDQAY